MGTEVASSEFQGRSPYARILRQVTESRNCMKLVNTVPHNTSQNGLNLRMEKVVKRVVILILYKLYSKILFTIIIMLLLAMWRPILFRQRRPGRYGVPLTLYKFRTMADKRDAQSQLLPPSDSDTLAAKIQEVLCDPLRMETMLC